MPPCRAAPLGCSATTLGACFIDPYQNVPTNADTQFLHPDFFLCPQEPFRVLGNSLKPNYFVSTRSSPVTRLQLLGAPLNHAMSMVNRILCEKPTLNCYSYCYVKPSSYNLAVATATFVLQIAMLALLGTDSYSTVLDWISGEATPFALWEATSVRRCGRLLFCLAA